MQKYNRARNRAKWFIPMAACGIVSAAAQAQESNTSLRFDEIVVTATKKSTATSIQETPLAVTAYGEKQLERLHVRDIASLSFLVPNVQLEGQAAFRGYANFSIRGMGIYSTIPSSTPTVGVFVDEVYLGVNAGIVFDAFDLSGVEILRGPQGLLFGRNVTAGAVLMRTTDPADELTVNAKLGIESGPQYTASGVVSGPLTENGILKGKLAAYYSKDEGYFHNLFDDNKSYGESDTVIARAALTYDPENSFSTTIKYEYGKTEGDGPASQNHAVFSRNSFDFAHETTGFIDAEWNQLIISSGIDVALGDGRIVNIFGWREVEQSTLSDADSSPLLQFNFGTYIKQHQWSDELRYSGRFGPVDTTIGFYYYSDQLDYIEHRTLSGGLVNSTGGGTQKSSTWAVFSQFDVHVSEQVVVNLGARYSRERKNASIQRLVATSTGPCSITTGTCSSYNFHDTNSWGSFTPKIGLQWEPTDTTNAYAFWTKGFRSGGYNMRNTSAAAPGPYDQETVSTIEVGLKQSLFEDKVRFNIAAFHNKYKDLQRDVAIFEPVLGSIQITANTADVTIKGFEAESTIWVMENLNVEFNVGHTDAKFNNIVYDLSGNGSVGPEDYMLQLPRLSPWSYGAAINYDQEIAGVGDLSIRIAFNHRDRQFATDNNRGVLNPADMLDANITLYVLDTGMSVSVYGKNILNETTFGADTPLPFSSPDQTNSPLNKGRVLGLEFQYRY